MADEPAAAAFLLSRRPTLNQQEDEVTQVYAEAGQQIVVHVQHDTVAAVPTGVDFAFSGYLVNLP